MNENIKQNTTTVETEITKATKATTPAPTTSPSQTPASTPLRTPEVVKAPEEQAPTTPSTTATGQAIQNALTRTALPEGYLADGSMVDADGVMRAEYTGAYAEELAKRLKLLPASTFSNAFLKEAKGLRKKKTPYGEQKNCALGMETQAKKLVYRKKDPAPAVLLDVIRAATATVKDPATFDVLYKHLDAIYSNMLCS